jgi:putative chitinase
MTAEQWLPLLALGALLGACGQMTRVVVGVTKAKREHSAAPLDLQQLLVGLLIGAVSGVLATMATTDGSSKTAAGGLDATALMGLVAAGYAGVDFLEGMAGKLGSTTPTAPAPPAPPPSPPPSTR